MDFHETIQKAYRRLGTCMYRPNGYNCRTCGATLGTTYLEERLYAVRCDKCKTVTLLTARCPQDAEAAVGLLKEGEND